MRTRFLLYAFAGLPLSMGAQNNETAEPTTYPIAEYDRAATIVMHEPNEELFVGTMHPQPRSSWITSTQTKPQRNTKPIRTS